MAHRTTRNAVSVLFLFTCAALLASPRALVIKDDCASSSECTNTQACLGTKCRDPCPGVCGNGALCTVTNHVPRCTCPVGTTGDPFDGCTPDNNKQCTETKDCSQSMVCVGGECRHACSKGPCGTRALCTARSHAPICSCPDKYVGNPFIVCNPETKCKRSSECKSSEACLGGKCRDMCEEISCGTRAVCTVRSHIPICSCPPGFAGDPFESCDPENKCTKSSECGQSEACLNGACSDPCEICGTGATCIVRNHFPACSCPSGSSGDPFTNCNIENRTPADTPSTSTAATPAATGEYLPTLHRRCLRCLCEASTTCNLEFGCQEGYCGPFGVSHAYWNEAGRPVQPNADPQNDEAFEDCAKEYECASRIVNAYIIKLKKDCNDDGLINCDDFAMMHHNGGYSCHLPLNRTEGSRIFRRRYLKCKGEEEDDDPLGQSVAATF